MRIPVVWTAGFAMWAMPEQAFVPRDQMTTLQRLLSLSPQLWTVSLQPKGDFQLDTEGTKRLSFRRRYNVGRRDRDVLHWKKVDEDFFEL